MKCLLKTELEVIRNEAGGFFISEPESEFCFAKQQCGALGQLVVQQQEVKRNPIVSGEKIQIGFVLNAVRESKTFQAAVRAKTAEDSVNYFGDHFSSASHILCLHLRPRSLVSCLKKKWPAVYCRTRYLDALRFCGYRRETTRLRS